MEDSVKYLTHKHENLSFDKKSPHIKLDGPLLAKQTPEDPRWSLAR